MPAPQRDATEALAAAARLGPYFTWQPHDGHPERPSDDNPRQPADGEPGRLGDGDPERLGDGGPGRLGDGDFGWRPLGAFTDPEVIAGRVGVAQQMLCRMSGLGPDRIEERVVASTVFLGLASRLLSPLVAAAAVGGGLPLADPGRLWWRAVESGPVPIAYRDLAAVDCAGWDAADVAVTLIRLGVRGLVEPVLDAFRTRFALSPQVLWGNVASALGGAAGMIADNAPQSADRSAAVVIEMLARTPLAGMATLTRPDTARSRWFLVRNNCCLYYRIPGGGFCGDCVLTPEDTRRRHWQSVLTR